MKHRLNTILQLGIPIILAMLSQSLINLVDAALVGPLGDQALAAVGAGSYANFVALSLLAGLSAAIQAQVARRIGEGKSQFCAVPVNHGILIAFLFALPLSLILYIASFMLLVLSLPLILIPKQVLGLFLYDPELLVMGAAPLQLTGLGLILDAPALVFIQALLGAGANRTVLCIRVIAQWLILLPLSWLAGPVLGLGLTAVWIIPTLQRALCSLAFFMVWYSRRWCRIRI